MKLCHYNDIPHDHILAVKICKGFRPKISEDTPKLITDLINKCWDAKAENRPTAYEINDCLRGYHRSDTTEEKKEIIKLAEVKRQEIIKSKNVLVRYK